MKNKMHVLAIIFLFSCAKKSSKLLHYSKEKCSIDILGPKSKVCLKEIEKY